MAGDPSGAAPQRTGRAFVMAILCLSGLVAGTAMRPQKAHAGISAGGPAAAGPQGAPSRGADSGGRGVEGLLQGKFYAMARGPVWGGRAEDGRDGGKTPEGKGAGEMGPPSPGNGADEAAGIPAGPPPPTERPALLPLTSEEPGKRELGTELDMVELNEAPANLMLAFGMNRDITTDDEEMRITMRFRLPF